MSEYQSFAVTKESPLYERSSPHYYILSYYHLVPIENPHDWVEKHFAFFKEGDYTGRIYLCTQGINGTLSAKQEDACRYMKWLHGHDQFSGTEFKVQEHPEHVFARMTVKVKKELVALGMEVDLNKRGVALSARDWKKMLEEEKEALILDVRNDYEWLLGHFENAISPPCETFKDFPRFAEEIAGKIDPKKTKVMMYCTGGIRCEFFSSILKEKGIENVYQLDGGIIKYGMEEKSSHWRGKVFVFDDRLAASISDVEAPTVAKCHHCQKEAEKYYNCANMDCNFLFISCQECLEKHQGCCKDACRSAKRVRPFKNESTPFRRWYHYTTSKEGCSC